LVFDFLVFDFLVFDFLVFDFLVFDFSVFSFYFFISSLRFIALQQLHAVEIPLLRNSSSSSESVSPHNFLTCCFFSSSEAETGFGLKEIGGRRGPGADTIALGTTMEKRERARCCDCDCFDPAATTADLLPAAIEAHEDEDEDDDDEDEGGTTGRGVS
jgi:hypothetical protein